MPGVNFETERLIIRPLVPDDAEAVFRWCGDPDVNTYMIYPLYHRVEDVRTWLEGRDVDDPDNYDEGICLKSTGELIGSGGMRYVPERNAWEIGYNLRADQWGHGYTVEYLTALLDLVRKLMHPKDESVVYENKPQKSDLHPTMKPVKLVARFIVNSSRPGAVVLDIFGGSGSTMIAAEQLGRKCYMMELDPKYCDVIVARWEQLTGKKAKKIKA